MKKLFGEQIQPNVYSQTRIIPSTVIKKLFISIFNYLQTDFEINQIADIGCGCGRLLPGLFLSNNSSKITGLDISQSMLSAIPQWVSNNQRMNLIKADCRDSNTFERDSIDFVLMHWLLNTTEGWEDIILNILKWKKELGVIVWFEERSNLYSAIDGHIHNSDINSMSAVEYDFWYTWYDSLENFSESTLLTNRKGLKMESDLPTTMLSSFNYNIVKLNDSKQVWSKSVTLKWLFENIFLRRAFSNFWQIPDPNWDKSLNKLLSFLSRYNNDLNHPVVLKYSSTPVIAMSRG